MAKLCGKSAGVVYSGICFHADPLRHSNRQCHHLPSCVFLWGTGGGIYSYIFIDPFDYLWLLEVLAKSFLPAQRFVGSTSSAAFYLFKRKADEAESLKRGVGPAGCGAWDVKGGRWKTLAFKSTKEAEAFIISRCRKRSETFSSRSRNTKDIKSTKDIK